MSHEDITPLPRPTDQQEATYAEDSRKRFIERMRAFAENDPRLFATRTVEAIESLLTEKIPAAERTENAEAQELVSQMHALGGLNAVTENPNAQWWRLACRRRESAGFVAGLTASFRTLTEHISGRSISVQRPAQQEPKGQPPERPIDPQK
jgi:hypothetical protein